MKKATLVDVAKEADVSAITVSRALRTPDMVSTALRQRVERAVAKTGYVPNKAASMLASSKTNSIVVLVPSLSNNVFDEVLRGIEEAARSANVTIQIGNTMYDPLREQQLLTSLLNPLPAGVILTGGEQNEASKRILQQAQTPVVQIMDLVKDPIHKVVGFSNYDGAVSALHHMLDAGYKRIGFIGAQMDPRAQDRLRGYRNALYDSGLQEPERTSVTNEKADVKLGGTLLTSLLTQHPDCDAVLCSNDDLALGVLFECQRRGLNVPRDVGICGFNDLGIVSEAVPRVTSVCTPRFEIGQCAVETVLDPHINTRAPVLDLGFKLHVRESTQP